MRPVLRSFLPALAACGLLLAPAAAQELLPPRVEAELDEVAAALDAMLRDGRALMAAAGRLLPLIEVDPSLAEPLQQRFHAMVRESRSVAAPELRALLLPLLMMNAIPPGARATTLGRDDLQFRPVDDEAFLAGPGTPPAAHRYRLEWKDLPAAAMTLEVALRDGVHFEIAANDCPERPSGSGSCTVAVRFDIAGNGIRQDTLSATYGPLTARVQLSGQGSGFPPADPRIVAPAETTVRLDPATPGAGESRVAFSIVNRGAGPLPPFAPRLWSREKLKPEFWKVDRSSSCTTAATMPGESCSIVLAFDPTRNVQEGALFALPDPNGRNDLRKHGEVFGYARGFVEHLPAGLLTNGDPCPAAGTGAEVVVRRGVAGPGRVDVIWLHTLSCSAWQGGRNGDMRCADAGVLQGGARREWKRTSVAPSPGACCPCAPPTPGSPATTARSSGSAGSERAHFRLASRRDGAYMRLQQRRIGH